MELFLNLAWLAVVLAVMSLWFHSRVAHAEQTFSTRRQLIALAVLVAVLFPVISVSDDLLAVQNQTETDNYLRRDHLLPADPHPVEFVAFFVPPVRFAGLGMVFLRFMAPGVPPVKKAVRPELAAIDNRPPPIA